MLSSALPYPPLPSIIIHARLGSTLVLGPPPPGPLGPPGLFHFFGGVLGEELIGNTRNDEGYKGEAECDCLGLPSGPPVITSISPSFLSIASLLFISCLVPWVMVEGGLTGR